MIEIRLPGQLLLLTAVEVSRLLAARPDIWQIALKRGKAMTRARQRLERTPKRIREAELEIADQVRRRCL
jgi:hypothetical protein